MKKTLTELKAVDTNAELRRLRDEHMLSLRQIAEHCVVSYDTAVGWVTRNDSVRHRRMPNNALELLQSKLGEKSHD